MRFQEHNNRQKAKALAEYITGQKLRHYLADKVRHYVGSDISVFDGACGSGQLEQYITPNELYAVEIQAESCQALACNFSQAKIYNQSFFTFDDEILADCVVMNPPFSIKFKDLSDNEKTQIQLEFEWKKSGVVDDIFVLKAMKYTKRYGFFILFLGLTYRQTEKKFRELIGNQVVELNRISNAFDDTSIDVLFLVLDKEKTSNEYFSELVDFKTGERYEQTLIIDSDNWQLASRPVADKFGADFDVNKLNQELLDNDLKKLDTTLLAHRNMQFLTGIDFMGFCDKAMDIIKKHKLKFKNKSIDLF